MVIICVPELKVSIKEIKEISVQITKFPSASLVIVTPLIQLFEIIVNSRYRHTLGTPKNCAFNVIVPITRESCYRLKCACNEGISKYCSQSSYNLSAMSI